jgi:pyruvate ferredoxin oxidoreductase gamma subunit
MSYQLPYVSHRGFCNVLLSAIGGDGANMATKLLFKIAVNELGMDGAYDAKYGSEKKGTPTDVSLRLCNLGTNIRTSGPTERPHILAIFRDGLIDGPNMNAGLQANATVIANTTDSPDEVRRRLKLNSGTIICFDAEKIAEETKSRLNMPIMALVARTLGFPADVVEASIVAAWPYVKDRNIAAFKAANEGIVEKTFEASDEYPLVPPAGAATGQVGYLNMLNGGSINAIYHSSGARGSVVAGHGLNPHFDKDACIGCVSCISVCSDPGSLIWKDGFVSGVDSAYCKGCMRCVEVCPSGKKGKALTLPAQAEAAA